MINIIANPAAITSMAHSTRYARPGGFEATRKQPDDFSTNKVGEIMHQESYDVGADLGGPLIKNKLSFFGSFNPSIQRDLVQRSAPVPGCSTCSVSTIGDIAHLTMRSRRIGPSTLSTKLPFQFLAIQLTTQRSHPSAR